jgi:flagellar biogenesis protein FliO
LARALALHSTITAAAAILLHKQQGQQQQQPRIAQAAAAAAAAMMLLAAVVCVLFAAAGQLLFGQLLRHPSMAGSYMHFACVQVIGNVSLGQHTSIWYGAILRGKARWA